MPPIVGSFDSSGVMLRLSLEGLLAPGDWACVSALVFSSFSLDGFRHAPPTLRAGLIGVQKQDTAHLLFRWLM